MIQTMTTIRAAGHAGGAAAAPLARVGDALRRATGFAITASGLAVIAAHLATRAIGG